MKKILFIIFVATCCNAMAQTIPSYVPTNGLVAWYPFNGNAIDESANTNNGTVNGATLTTDRFGNANSAYSFNGSTTQYIDVPHSANFVFTAGQTISVWLCRTGTLNSGVDWNIFLSKGAITYNGMNFFCNDAASTVGYNYISGNYNQGNYFSNAANISLNQWINVIVVNDLQTIKLYANGILIGQNNILFSGTSLSGSQLGPMNIGKGRGNYGGEKGFNGIIDDIAIYNRALTQQEITGLYTNASPCVPPTVSTITGTSTICANNTTTFVASATGTNASTTYAWSGPGGFTATSASTGNISTAGTYTCIISNTASCTASASQVLTVNSIPTVTATATANAVCVGMPVTLTGGGANTYTWSNSVTNDVAFSPTTTNTYTVTGTNANGCTNTATKTVTVNPLPTVTLTSLTAYTNYYANAISLNGTPTGGTYTGAGVSGVSFNPQTAGLGHKTIHYSYTNLLGCSKSVSQSTIVYDTTGIVCTTYDTITTHVTITDTNIVTVTDTTFLTVTDTTFLTVTDTNLVTVTDTLLIHANLTGIAPPNNSNLIKVYPNPAQNHLFINNGNFALMSGYTCQIVNALGQQLFSSAINQQQFDIDISNWAGNSIYFLKIKDATNTVIENRKIVLN